MILLPCPWCGPRNAEEFHHAGEARQRPEAARVPITAWRRYLYETENRCGWVTEQWFHRAGCRRYITVERHTQTNEVRAAAAAGRTA